MKILVTGGAGYIGSHTVVSLQQAGYETVIVDNLYNANEDVPERIRKITGIMPGFVKADCCDAAAMEDLFSQHDFDAVIHFAGLKAVGESVKVPLSYYRNNLDSAITILETMKRHGCRRFIFSSSATVYGPHNPSPYREDMPALETSSPYGRTKVMIEQMLVDEAAADPEFSAVLLRYFNPIGAHASGLLGDDPNGIPNNLMPYITRVAAGKLEKLTVFGDDYPTPDGTCRRDYLHVVDLAEGHLAALKWAAAHTGAEAFNLGTGCGVSVQELVDTFERETGVTVPHVYGARRDGDLAEFWADASKAERLLGWKAEKTIADMCRDSWHFAETRMK